MHRWIRSGIVVLALIACLATTPSRAAVINVQFSGSLQSIPGVLAGTFSTGQAFSGRYSYDTASPRIPTSNPDWAGYAYVDFSLNIGSLTFAATGTPGPFITNAIQILDGVGGFDTYTVSASGFAGGPIVVDGLTAMIARLQLTSAGNPLPGGANLPAAAPVLADYGFTRQISVLFRPDPNSIADQVTLFGTVSAIGPTAVPEPGSLALLLVGIGSLALLHRRSARRRPG